MFESLISTSSLFILRGTLNWTSSNLTLNHKKKIPKMERILKLLNSSLFICHHFYLHFCCCFQWKTFNKLPTLNIVNLFNPFLKITTSRPWKFINNIRYFSRMTEEFTEHNEWASQISLASSIEIFITNDEGDVCIL